MYIYSIKYDYIIKYIINNNIKIMKKDGVVTEGEILKKLQKSSVKSAEEYELIISNLQQQSIRLLQNREQLSKKVQQLTHKQRQIQKQMSIRKKIDPASYYKRLKKQLENSYKQLELYQKKCYNSLNKNAINLQLRDLINQFICIDQQIKCLRLSLIDEKQEFKKLQKAIKQQQKYSNRNYPQLESLQYENKEIKKKISQLKIIEDLTEHIEIRVQDNVIGLKQKGRFFQKLNNFTVQEVKRQKMLSKMEIIHDQNTGGHSRRLKTESIVTDNSKAKRYQTLNPSYNIPNSNTRLNKNKSFSKSKTNEQWQQSEKLFQIKEIKREQLKQNNYKMEEQLNNLQIKYNKSKINSSELKGVLYEQERRKMSKLEKLRIQQQKQYCDVHLQVDLEYEDLEPLRIDFIGQLNQNNNDKGMNFNIKQPITYIANDRLLLRSTKDVRITGLLTYENKYGLVFIRASYSPINLVTPIPDKLPDKYLKQRCKTRKIVLSDENDYLQWFKVYYHKERRVVRIEVFSHNKIKFEAGKSKQQITYDVDNITAFKIDNIGKQLPVCLKTAYSVIGNGKDYVMSGFGLEISQPD